MSRLGKAVSFAALLMFVSLGPASADPADRIFFGGPIHTVDDANPNAEAVAVRGGKIVAVGSRDDIANLAGESTEWTDLKGRTLIPGFIDGHAHFYAFGAQALGANLLADPDGKVETIDDLVATLEEWAARPSTDLDLSNGWIFGLGYDDAILGRHPTAEDLDNVSKEVPVIAVHISGHFSAVNTAGLIEAGLLNKKGELETREGPDDPPGGKIHREDDGKTPNGTLEEAAHFPVLYGVISSTDEEVQRAFLTAGQDLAMSFGYTTAHEGRTSPEQHEAMADFAEQGRFKIDVVSYPDYTDVSPLRSEWYGREYMHRYRVGGVKITLDGSPQGRTAWRSVPYHEPPAGEPLGYMGYRVVEDESVRTVFDQAYANGWQILAHANGDAAIDQMIDAAQAATKKHGLSDRRPVLIHGQFATLDQLDRLAELRVIPSLFPMHTFYWGDWYRQIIGEAEAQKISPIRSALERSQIVTSHTDAPIALPNLIQVMKATVYRTSRSGKVIGEAERLTPLEALKSVTLWGAYQHFEEDTKGSIQVGKLADLVILSHDPIAVFSQPKPNGEEITVVETIKEGKTVYAAPSMSSENQP